jgi:hypothetical protein
LARRIAFCAVLITPAILVYGVPVAIGIVGDIVQLDGGQMAGVLSVSAVACCAAVPAA